MRRAWMRGSRQCGGGVEPPSRWYRRAPGSPWPRLDHEERVELWYKIQEKILADVPNFPLVMAAWQTISTTRIANHSTNAEGFEGSMARVEVVG